MIKKNSIYFILLFVVMGCVSTNPQIKRPNILLVISDDQSYPHASAYGYPGISTPGFDRIAKDGILFSNAYAASPGCSPSRAALLTGYHPFQLEEAGTHASGFPAHYLSFPEILEAHGYAVGFTGKGWGPGKYEIAGRTKNPAGKAWQEQKMETPEGINPKDYASNFEVFLNNKNDGEPFCFWLGTHEPHRSFKKGIGLEAGKSLETVEVPGFLPDTDEIRSDILDYIYEIEWFDQHLQRVISLLEERGELDNTLIIVTSDNGMAFPRAKANTYEYGIHVPLAISYGKQIEAQQISEDLVGFVDIAPTILEFAGLKDIPEFPSSGNSLAHILLPSRFKTPVDRQYVFSSRERHSSSRFHSLAYPQRAMRENEYLLVWNMKPERWPAGAPVKYGNGNYPLPIEVKNELIGPPHGGYHDIDACPTLDFLIDRANDPAWGKYLQLAVDLRPEYELYNVVDDPACLNNLLNEAQYDTIFQRMKGVLASKLRDFGDPRMLGNGDIWESYPRYSRLRMFPEPDWVIQNPDKLPEVPWLKERWELQLNETE